MAEAKPSTVLSPALDSALTKVLGGLATHGYQTQRWLPDQKLSNGQRRLLFLFLGHIAKANGRVSEQDINYAESLMSALSLSKNQRKRAIDAFRQGKELTGLRSKIGFFQRLCRPWRARSSVVVAACLCHGACVGKPASTARKHRCEDAIDRLGLPPELSEELLLAYEHHLWPTVGETEPPPTTLEQACRVLGVSRRDSKSTIKRVYRRKVSECHPDKLAQQNLRPAELASAKNRLLRIQQAWDLINKRLSD